MEDQSAARANSAGILPIDTILLVDDDEIYLFLVKRILHQSGFCQQIITAHNGIEGLQLLQVMTASGGKLPEIIFLDVKMPIMDGFEFLEEVFKSTDLPLSQTRIYMCTSSMLDKDKEKAHLYPIAGFLTKPLTTEVLKDILV